MIGNVEIPNRTVLAPMAGVTNSAFRTIAKELGAEIVCQFCQTAYHFDENDLEELIRDKS